MRVIVCADQAHSSVERAGLLGGVKLRLLPADENLRLRGETLESAIQEDRRNGLIPFYVSILIPPVLSSSFLVY
jgi:glutamate/tyrosine decarboxylase-like PLP-dependent enzyme